MSAVFEQVQPTLADLAGRHGCDKGLTGPSDAWFSNNYVDVYTGYFSSLRYREVRLLEIGIGVVGPNWNARIAHGANASGGASLRMWSDYFPNGWITGADINDASHLDIPRVTTYLLDQSSDESLRNMYAALSSVQFDVIIDDGSHRAGDQQKTLRALFPLLRPGGLYFIEDLVGDVPGRHGDRAHVPTRKLLLSWYRTGVVPTPNSVGDFDWKAVSEINFHVPRVEVPPKQFARGMTKRLLKLAERRGMPVRYVPDSFRMAVLRRRGGGCGVATAG